MSIENIKNSLPEYARDLKLNLSSIVMDNSLTNEQKSGCFLACAIASRSDFLIKNIYEEVKGFLDEKHLNAAKAAASIMSMNNIYYRFTHVVANPEYKSMQAKLRMNIIGSHGIEKTDFELWSLAVSAINGCGMCIDSHEAMLKKHDFTKDQIQLSIRIASVMHAIAVTLEAEKSFS